METRAHHLLIGGFVLLFAAAAVAAALWLAGAGLDREASYYDIYFEESVAGLQVGGDVRYRGIKVGAVTGIGINPDDPTRARVTVDVGPTPIRQGDTATLVTQGITGVLFVNIEGARRGDPLLGAGEGETHPVIPSRPSALSEVFEGAPDLVAKAVVALDNLGRLADEENRARIAGILANLESMSDNLDRRGAQIDRLVTGLERVLVDLEAAGGSLNRTLAVTEELVAEDGEAVAGELRETLARLRQLLEETNTWMAENREPLHDFATRGLGEMTGAAVDAQAALARLTALLERLEREGAGALVAPPAREVEVEP